MATLTLTSKSSLFQAPINGEEGKGSLSYHPRGLWTRHGPEGKGQLRLRLSPSLFHSRGPPSIQFSLRRTDLPSIAAQCFVCLLSADGCWKRKVLVKFKISLTVVLVYPSLLMSCRLQNQCFGLLLTFN